MKKYQNKEEKTMMMVAGMVALVVEFVESSCGVCVCVATTVRSMRCHMKKEVNVVVLVVSSSE